MRDKKDNTMLVLVFIIFTMLILSMMPKPSFLGELPAAAFSTGYDFGVSEQVTSAKLKTMVESMTVSDIESTELKDGAVGNNQLANNAISAGKIQSQSILAAHVSNYVLTATQHSTNFMQGFCMTNFTGWNGCLWTLTNGSFNFGSSNVNLNFSNANISWSSSQIPGSAISNYNTSILYTNYIYAIGGNAYTWYQLMQLQTTETTGMVTVTAVALTQGKPVHAWIRLRDATTNVVSYSESSSSSLDKVCSLSATLVDSLTGSAKTYYVDLASANATEIYTNTMPSAGGQCPSFSTANGLGMRILQHK